MIFTLKGTFCQPSAQVTCLEKASSRCRINVNSTQEQHKWLKSIIIWTYYLKNIAKTDSWQAHMIIHCFQRNESSDYLLDITLSDGITNLYDTIPVRIKQKLTCSFLWNPNQHHELNSSENIFSSIAFLKNFKKDNNDPYGHVC